MTDTATIPGTKPPLSDEALNSVRAAALWNVVHRPATAGTFPTRVLAAHRSLKELELNLASQQLAHDLVEGPTAALLEIKANIRQLRAAVKAVSDSPQSVARLPRIVVDNQPEEPRIAAVAELYLHSAGGEFSAQQFVAFVSTLQENQPLALDELWSSAAFLQFILLESLLKGTATLLHATGANPVPPISVYLRSLTAIGHADWSSLIEPLIVFDAILRQDPASAYASMDFDGRELYRRRIALIARHSDCTESQVAQIALELAREGINSPFDDPRMQLRRIHVGYYLIDSGFPKLAARSGYLPPLIERLRTFLRASADYFYITGIQVLTILFIAVLIFLPLSRFTLFDSLIAALMLIMPAMQCAVDLVKSTITAVFDPDRLPKLDFSKAISPDCVTLVAVPTLLLNEGQVRSLVTDLEVRFLANRDQHLHFALLTDLPDSVTDPRENDSHPLVDLVVRLIGELNNKYTSPNSGAFILLHRKRIFSVRQGVWMGWERKRGKLLDLNKLLAGEYDAFPIKAGRLDALKKVRYVLTLDSDTQLPRGSAARLIGAIAHPLHQAVIHPKLGIVVAGYGILQPRIGISVRSASRSRMAAIYSGQSGFDIYARAISDAYQDLYGEGIFTGKGIYEVATLHSVLEHRFPRNSLLSHDLIEGAYARAGLVTDVELVDDYPSHLSAYNRRKHRWVRGDWQIVQWICSRVPDESGRRVPSPISSVARWKIFDNLRRSLVEPFTLILFVAGWLGLPGGPVYWTIVPLILLIFPTLVQFSFGLGRALAGRRRGSLSEALSGFWTAVLVALLNLIFLPHQTLLSLDAIIRALVRRFVTGERLLEWETAAQAELRSVGKTPVDRYLALSPVVALITAMLVLLTNRHPIPTLVVAAPVLLLWCIAPIVTVWLNTRPREQKQLLNTTDKAFLMTHALLIWRFFRQFGGERHHYLIPDNVEEEHLFEAARVSPTNIGLLLNARQAACEFGFLTAPEFALLTDYTLNTIDRLHKFRGHLYNWYDTHTLQPLDGASFISTVDSGNFVASLYTLRSGALTLRHQPLVNKQVFTGLHAHWQLLKWHQGLPERLSQLSLPDTSASIAEWIAWLLGANDVLATAEAVAEVQGVDSWWMTETRARVSAASSLGNDNAPWLLPEYAPLLALQELNQRQRGDSIAPCNAVNFCVELDARLVRAWLKLVDNSELLVAGPASDFAEPPL